MILRKILFINIVMIKNIKKKFYNLNSYKKCKHPKIIVNIIKIKKSYNS